MIPLQPPPGWSSAKAHARETGNPAAQLIQWMRAGALEGAELADGWYLAPPLVSLEFGTTGECAVVDFIFGACRMGPYLTAGRGRQVIALQLDDPEPLRVRAALDDAMTRPPVLPLSIELGGHQWLIDSSLWCDLAAALVSFEVLETGAIDGMPVADDQ